MNYKKTILVLASLVACAIFLFPLTPAYAAPNTAAPGTAAVQLNDDAATATADTTTVTPPADTTPTAPPESTTPATPPDATLTASTDTAATALADTTPTTPTVTTTTTVSTDTGTTVPAVSDAAGTTPPPPPPPAPTTTDSSATTPSLPNTTAPLLAPPTGPSGTSGTLGYHHPFTPPASGNPPPSDPSGTLGHHRPPHPNPNPYPYPYYPNTYYQYPYSYYPYYNYYNSVFPYYYNYYQAYPVQPQQDYAPTISSFTANPNYVQPGQSATLSWVVSNANSVSVSPSVGSVAISSSAIVTPTATTTYTITATNSVGTVTAMTTVTVAPYVTTYPTYSSPPVDTSTVTTQANMPLTPEGSNLWPLIVLLIALMAVSAAVIIALVSRKPAAAVQHSGTASAFTAATGTAPAATLPATGTPHTTPIGAGTARLVSAGGGELSIRGGAMPLGRSDLRSLTTADKSDLISRKHFTMEYENGDYYIEDSNSTNGTRLNGESIRGKGKQLLRNGDNIEIADAVKLTFRT